MPPEPRFGLREAEKVFCRNHGIPELRLFDAVGSKPAQYGPAMQAKSKWAAYNVTPCRRSGHSLRNRHGTCLMCNVQTVAHLLRSKASGYVYVARGAAGRLMKIGFSTEPEERLAIARSEGWGGYRDWRLVAVAWSARGGAIETELHGYFRDKNVPLAWKRNGQSQVAREAYLADLPEAAYQLTLLCDAPPKII